MHPVSIIVNALVSVLNISQGAHSEFGGLARQRQFLNASIDISDTINFRQEAKKHLLYFLREKWIEMNVNVPFTYPILLKENFLRVREYNFVFMDTSNFSYDISRFDGNKRDKFYCILTRRYDPADIFKVANDTSNYFWTTWITNVVVFICCNSNNEVVLYSYAPFTLRVCKSVELYELGDWTNDTIFFPDKYKDLYQCPMRVLHMYDNISTNSYTNSEEMSETLVSEYMENILPLLGDALNFHIDWVRTPYSKVGTVLKNGTATEMMAQLINRSIDISDVQSRNSMYEASVLERTSLYYTGDYSFVMKNFEASFNWRNFIYPFPTVMWFFIILSLILAAFIVTIYKRLALLFRPTYSLLNVWSTFLGISSIKMNNNPLKLQVSIWLLYSLIITNAYQGILVGFLTTPRKYNAISTLEELLKSGIPFGGNKIALWFFQTENSTVSRQLLERFILLRQNETTKKINDILDGEEFAITKNRDKAEYMNTQNPDTKQFYIISEPIIHYSFQYQLPKGSPWFPNINLVTSRLFECGIAEKIRRNVYGNRKDKNIKKNNSRVVLRMDHMFPVFVLYCIGILFAIVVLIVEITFP